MGSSSSRNSDGQHVSMITHHSIGYTQSYAGIIKPANDPHNPHAIAIDDDDQPLYSIKQATIVQLPEALQTNPKTILKQKLLLEKLQAQWRQEAREAKRSRVVSAIKQSKETSENARKELRQCDVGLADDMRAQSAAVFPLPQSTKSVPNTKEMKAFLHSKSSVEGPLQRRRLSQVEELDEQQLEHNQQKQASFASVSQLNLFDILGEIQSSGNHSPAAPQLEPVRHQASYGQIFASQISVKLESSGPRARSGKPTSPRKKSGKKARRKRSRLDTSQV